MGHARTGEYQRLSGLKECHVVAACDLDKEHLSQAVGKINEHYKTRIANHTTITAK